MVSANDIKLNWTAILRMAQTSGLQIEYHYKERKYRLVIEATGEAWKHQRKSYIMPNARKKIPQILTGVCSKCGGVTAAGLCLAVKCNPR